jgi:hypothetical protein
MNVSLQEIPFFVTLFSSLFLYLNNIKKVKVVPVRVMEVYGRGGGMAPFILNLSTRWR